MAELPTGYRSAHYYDPGPSPGSRSALVPTPGANAHGRRHRTAARAAACPSHRLRDPARSSRLGVRPSDGFTYSVATYSEVKAGSTLGHTISYYKPDGELSINSGPPPRRSSTRTTALLAAILVIVVIVGALVVYRLVLCRALGVATRRVAALSTQRGSGKTAPSAASKRQQQADKARKNAAPKGSAAKGSPRRAAPKNAPKDSGGKGAAAQDAPTTEPATPDPATEPGDAATEYCIACGEELTAESPFCPTVAKTRS